MNRLSKQISFYIFFIGTFFSCNVFISDCDRADLLQEQIDKANEEYAKKIREGFTSSRALGLYNEFFIASGYLIKEKEITSLTNKYWKLQSSIEHDLKEKNNCKEVLDSMQSLVIINEKRIKRILEKLDSLYTEELKKRSRY